MGCPALELAGHWVELGLSVEMEISRRAPTDWYYVGLGGLWWTNVLNSALPPQKLRPDPWLEHQDPVSHTAAGTQHAVCSCCLGGSLLCKVTVHTQTPWGPDGPINELFIYYLRKLPFTSPNIFKRLECIPGGCPRHGLWRQAAHWHLVWSTSGACALTGHGLRPLFYSFWWYWKWDLKKNSLS